MIEKNHGHMCCCPCHKKIVIHEDLICNCGGPIVPPYKPPVEYLHQLPKEEKLCPPPKYKLQPGTIDISQPEPFHVPRAITPPNKPKPGDPGEVAWFQGEINNIRRNGPTFGPRKDEYLPFLLIRSSSSDRGARPLFDNFWESPDILVTPNQEASTASLIPPFPPAGIAKAGAPNTLYAHVWNLGKSPAYRVRVEFYWFNPTLGISRADANLIGAAWVDLANRFTLYPDWVEVDGPSGKYVTKGSHAIVRCPETWVPSFENNGHECLVVRVFEPILDPLALNNFSSRTDRHIAQRNITVVQASSPAAIDLDLYLGYTQAPVSVEAYVELYDPKDMEWLKLLTGKADPGLQLPSNRITYGLLPPKAAGSAILAHHKTHLKHHDRPLTSKEIVDKGCDPLQIPFHASIDDIGSNQAIVLRIRQFGDSVIGGYSVVLKGE